MITVTISGPRQSGKSTIAVLLKELLAGLGHHDVQFVVHPAALHKRHVQWNTAYAKQGVILKLVQPVEIRFVDDPETP